MTNQNNPMDEAFKVQCEHILSQGIHIDFDRSTQGHFIGFYSRNCHELPMDWVFVFGSNLSGRHGAGAALTAHRKYGRPYGDAVGFHASVFYTTYAIPTKDEAIIRMTLSEIQDYVEKFCDDTHTCEKPFYVTPIGTGLSGYQHEQIAPMFVGARHCLFPAFWKPFLCR